MEKKILLSILAVGGVALLIWTYSRHLRIKEAQDWPTAEAEIVSSEIDSHQRRRRSGSGSGSRKVTMYTPVVEYEYSVDGDVYTSKRISFFNGSSNVRADALEVIRKYPRGKVVSAHYNPSNPQNSVLETEPGKIFYVLLIFGVGFVLLGITGIVFSNE